MVNMEVEHELTVVQVEGWLNFFHPRIMVVALGSTHNMVSTNFVRKLDFP